MRMTSELLYESRLLAQERWRLLARALTGTPESESEPNPEALSSNRRLHQISMRRFSSFGLLRADHFGQQEAHCTWWLYSCLIAGQFYQLLVCRVNNCFTADQLIGFNNTGNVCVWPSEECLAYYILKNRQICRRRRVLELGGGMSCLAGALAAKYCEASSVTLTDGNARSVENVNRIVKRNALEGLARCAVVQWAKAAEAHTQEPSGNNGSDGERRSYDVILCADCLFFDEARLDLVDTIYGWLAEDGLALVMAPRRGATFRRFADAAAQRGLVGRQCERYDPELWARHLQLLASNPYYCPDIHFPVLLELTKPNHQRADYWKSQARKYCDFCKCWISDNRASVDFHESGKKHKENVGRRLKEIHKNSAKQAKQQKKFENDLEKMEKAAMEAYMKDVANNTRDITSDSIIQQKWSSEQANTESVNPNTIPGASPNAHPRYNQSISYASYGAADIDPLDPFAKQKLARLEAQNKAKSNKQAKKEKDKLEKIKKESENLEVEARRNRLTQRKVWYEARSQGHSYYWNIETNETMWEPPAVGYMSLNEQAAEAEEQALQEQMFEQIAKEQEKERAVTFEEQRANAERQKLKEFRKRFHENKFPEMREENEETVSYRRDYSVPDKLQPYGTWQVIETPKTDFQLPKEDVPIVTVSLNDEKPTSKKVFKEKTITAISIGDSDDESSVILFKKRKFGNRNVRKRMEND